MNQADDPTDNRDLQTDDQADNPPRETDNRADDLPDARWMTFDQLAKLRGISKLSAQALVRRHGWRRQRDNRGRVMALVPNDGPELRRQPDDQADNPPDRPDNQVDHQPDMRLDESDHPSHAAFETALASIEAAHAREIHALRERADAAQALADRTAVQLTEAEKRAETERLRAERAEQTVAAERSRADALRDRLEAAETQARTAEEAAAQARQHAREAEDAIAQLRHADQERRGQGRWVRLKAAWRGE